MAGERATMMEIFPVPLESLLKEIGLASDRITACIPLAGGRNNRVFRLDIADGPMLLKQYFRGGEWDRMAAEGRFLRFCAGAGVRRTPRLLAEDVENGLALHSWLCGERLSPSGLGESDVAEAAAFLGGLAKAVRRPEAATMPPARDACLCLEDYFRSPAERLVDLEAALLADPAAPLAGEALEFFRKELFPAWEDVRHSVLVGLAGKVLRHPFPVETLVVSPSDFGFHNALRRKDGGLDFVDFEYAGLDDPAKAIGDFVCQLDFPPPEGTMRKLALAAGGDAGAELEEKTRILLPLFRVKFVCIVLNDFKAIDSGRRDFAIGTDIYRRRQEQLNKAKKILREIEK